MTYVSPRDRSGHLKSDPLYTVRCNCAEDHQSRSRSDTRSTQGSMTHHAPRASRPTLHTTDKTKKTFLFFFLNRGYSPVIQFNELVRSLGLHFGFKFQYLGVQTQNEFELIGISQSEEISCVPHGSHLDNWASSVRRMPLERSRVRNTDFYLMFFYNTII